MKFVTFQDAEILNQIDKLGEFKLEEYDKNQNCCGYGSEHLESRVGYKPIFAFPLISKRDVLTRLMMEFPTRPEVMIVFKTNIYNTVGYTKLLQLLNMEYCIKEHKRCTVQLDASDLAIDSTKTFNEYVVPKISSEDILKIVRLTDNINTVPEIGRTMHDDFIDFIYDGTIINGVSKWLPKDNVKLIDCSRDSEEVCSKTKYMLEFLNEKTDLLSEVKMREIYSYIQRTYLK